SEDRGVQLVGQKRLGEVAGCNLDALGGRLVEPRQLARLEADGAEAASHLHRAVLQLGQVGCSSCSLLSVAVNATLSRVDRGEERFLQEVAGKAIGGQTDRAVAGLIELADHLAQRLD